MDLDGLKEVNDTQGHAQGDALIRNTTQYLKRTVRESDILARLGGDEFAILALECDEDGAEALFEKITTTLSSNEINASVGKAMHEPKQGLIETISEADRAMYAMKAEHHKERSR